MTPDHILLCAEISSVSLPSVSLQFPNLINKEAWDFDYKINKIYCKSRKLYCKSRLRGVYFFVCSLFGEGVKFLIQTIKHALVQFVENWSQKCRKMCWQHNCDLKLNLSTCPRHYLSGCPRVINFALTNRIMICPDPFCDRKSRLAFNLVLFPLLRISVLATTCAYALRCKWNIKFQMMILRFQVTIGGRHLGRTLEVL